MRTEKAFGARDEEGARVDGDESRVVSWRASEVIGREGFGVDSRRATAGFMESFDFDPPSRHALTCVSASWNQ
jgi:hypothetical protein